MAKKLPAAAAVPYGVHPGIAMVVKWLAELKDKTGRDLEEWLALIKKEGPQDEKACRAWLKDKHGLGTNSAWWLAERAAGKGADDANPAAYLRAAPGRVDALYSGGKVGLRPLHDQLVAVAATLGDDVRVCPCETIVPLYRNHVFAQIKPTTRTRIDLGLALGAMTPTGRLIDTGGAAKKDRITHRIPITCPADIDAEVRRWLQAAYEHDA
jgi:hypothetical protein